MLYIDGFALEGESGVTRDHERAADERQVPGQALGHAIDEIVLLGIAADVCKREHNDGKTWSRMRYRRRDNVVCPTTKPIPNHGISPYRTCDIFEALLAQISKLHRDLAANLIVGGR
jgi:hypothetical protein